MKSLNLNLQRSELLVIMAIIVSGIGMYYTSTVVEPVKEISEEEFKAGEIRSQQLKILTDLSAQLLNLTELAVEQNALMIKIQSAQGNVSDDARARIINNMENILPAINLTIQNITKQFENHSEQVKRHDESLKGAIKILEVPQSNFTAQKIAIANIEKVLENQEAILQRLNTTGQ